MVRKSTGMEQEVCQLKVTLRGIRPAIWRRLVVPADTTLTRLHRVLQIAMGWQDSHMHEFRIEGRRPAVCSARIGDVLTEIGDCSPDTSKAPEESPGNSREYPPVDGGLGDPSSVDDSLLTGKNTGNSWLSHRKYTAENPAAF